VYVENEISNCICLKLIQTAANSSPRNLEFIVDQSDADDLITFVLGYAKLFGNRLLECYSKRPSDPMAGKHFLLIKMIGRL
jgi:hypothetical protein